MKLTNFKINAMGTVSFTAQFKGMRKPQEFCVYPLQGGDDRTRVKVQSDSRIGYITNAGAVLMSPPRAGGSYFVHLVSAKEIDLLTPEELEALRKNVNSSAKVVETVCRTDNASAMFF